MRFWANFSRSIFRLAAQLHLKKIKPKMLEAVLGNSLMLFDESLILEIKSFIESQQAADGGFQDRAGKSDIYYSMFGHFLATTLNMNTVNERLAIFVKENVNPGKLKGVHCFCGAILYSKLIGLDQTTDQLRKEILKEVDRPENKQIQYTLFLGLLALYYLGDFFSIFKILESNLKDENLSGYPCPVVAALSVITSLSGNSSPDAAKILMAFYREKGGFAAVHKAPEDDILSTGVALFALQFMDTDLRMIKPDILAFVDDLYLDGGFRATATDFMTDIEYTFYGLLALGSLNK